MGHKVIGIAGLARCGKDTAADQIIKRMPEYTKASFADPMKMMLEVGFDMSREQLYGDLKETVDARYRCSPRHMTQTLGTEWGRKLIGDNVWVEAMYSRLERHGSPLVIPDVRFENEATFIRANGKLIHIFGRDTVVDNEHASEAGVQILSGDISIHNTRSLQSYLDLLDDVIADALRHENPSCFGRQLDVEACNHGCPVSDECYNEI